MKNRNDLIIQVPVEPTLKCLKNGRLFLKIRILATGVKGIIPKLNRNHCDFRVFDHFLKHGNPLGKILLMGITEEGSNKWRTLSAISISAMKSEKNIDKQREMKLIVFPPWNSSNSISWKNANDGEDVVFNPHHITFELKSNNEIQYHVKGVDRNIITPIEGECTKFADGFILGVLLIPGLFVLNRLHTMIGLTDWSMDLIDIERKYSKHRKMVYQNIPKKQPVFCLPKSKSNPEAESIICVFSVANNRWENRSFSFNPSTKTFRENVIGGENVSDLCWTVSVKIDECKYLNLMIRRSRRTPIGQFQWIPSKSIKVDDRWIIIGDVPRITQ